MLLSKWNSDTQQFLKFPNENYESASFSINLSHYKICHSPNYEWIIQMTLFLHIWYIKQNTAHTTNEQRQNTIQLFRLGLNFGWQKRKSSTVELRKEKAKRGDIFMVLLKQKNISVTVHTETEKKNFQPRHKAEDVRYASCSI